MLTKKQRLEQYGITTDGQILGAISRCCDILGNGKNKAAKVFIEKICRHESHFGTYPDSSKKYGEGLSQFDKISFDDVVARTKDKHIKTVLKYYGFNIKEMDYEELRHNLSLQIVMTRLKLKLIPDVFPVDDDGQWEYYKKYWNTESGKATREKWDKDTVGKCYFSVGE